MKVLLINGSPNEKGCTFTALSEIAEELNRQGIETEIFNIGRKPIRGCIGCGACRQDSIGNCVFEDDIVNIAVDKVKESDGIVVGSPVYFASANGSLISFLDRLFYCAKQHLAYKPAASIASARRAGTTATLDIINKYFTISNMPIISSQYWNMVHGNTPGQVRQDAEGLQTMRILGKNMAWVLKCIEAGKQQGIFRPEAEEQIKTNFIR